MLLKTGFSRSEIFLRVSANIRLFELSFEKRFPMAGSWVVRLTILRPGAICRVVTMIFMAIPRPPMMLTGLFIAMAGPMTIARWLSNSSVRLTFPMVVASFNYRFSSGTPWARGVTVVPPEDWAAANTTLISIIPIMLISKLSAPDGIIPTTFLMPAWKDFQPEKYGRLSLFVDIFNLLGQHYININQNPGGT